MENFILRRWEEEDLESLVHHANNPDIAKNLTNQFPYPYTHEKGKAFIEYARQNNPANIMAIVINGKAVGGIGIHPQTDIMCKNAELGYWLSQDYWGRGIITAAVKQMVEYGFKNWENISRIYARPFGTNMASQKVLEKCGFKLEARFEKNIFKNGEVLDELVYAIRR